MEKKGLQQNMEE